ncbi:hypothetical protein LguiA_020017 [Lonicera macranthoides]
MAWILLINTARLIFHEGLVVAATSIRKVGLLSVCAAKAMAVLEGLKLARAKGVKLVVKCCLDAISVVNQVNMFFWPYAEESNYCRK